MGKEVIISELEYYKCLDSIVRTLHKSRGVEITELLDKKHSEFLYSKLGIRVSCFMVWDTYDEKYILYQNDLIDSSGKFYPQIPFSLQNGDYEHIIDLAFIGERYTEYKDDMNPYWIYR